MNQQRLKSALLSRCQCCLRERPTSELWSEHFVHGDMENYGVMLESLCRIPRPETEGGRICYPCTGRLKDAVDFQKQVQDAQQLLSELLDDDEADMENKLDGFLERPIHVPSKPEPLKTEVDKEDSDNNYTDIEYLDVDNIDVTKGGKSKKDPNFIVLGNTVIQKIIRNEPVIESDDDDNDFNFPLAKIAKLDGKPTESPARVTGSTKDNRKAFVTSVNIPNIDRPIKVIKEVTRTLPKTTQKTNYVPVNPEENKHLQAKKDRKKHQDNVVALLLYTNATPLKGKYDTGYRCGFCKETYINASDLKTHTITCHTDEQKSKYMVNVEMYCFIVKLDLTDHRCNICGDSLDDYDGVWQHLKDHELNVHLNLKNQIFPYKFQDNGLFNCFMCNADFAYFRALSVHMNKHLNNYICENCGSGFLTKRNMLLHARLHTLGDYRCAQCDKHFSVKFKLKMHEQNVHRKKRAITNVCGFCGKRFPDSGTKMVHLEREHGVKRPLFQCDRCDKILINKRTLRSHMENVHMRIKKYQCPLCKKECYEKTNMERHIVNKHSNKKHLICKVCSKVFTRTKLLKIHERMHLKDRNYLCVLCQDQFESKAGLLSHLRGRHGITNDKSGEYVKQINQVVIVKGEENSETGFEYECLICQMQFSQKEDMMHHLKSAHGVIDDNFEEFVNEVEVAESEDEDEE